MQNRKISVVISVGGFTMPLGTFKIVSYAGKYSYTSKTDLVCPTCEQEPDKQEQYHCPRCDEFYSSWYKLKRVSKATGEEVPKPVLHDSKDPPQATIHKMDVSDFQQKYSDATESEKGIEPQDAMSTQNLQNLLVAVERLNKVVVLKWKEKYQENVAILRLSPSNRVVLQEVIPEPIAQIKSTMTVNMDTVTEQQIEMAQQLINQIPEVTDEVMTVSDYRTFGLSEDDIKDKPSAQVQDITAILQQMEEATAKATA